MRCLSLCVSIAASLASPALATPFASTDHPTAPSTSFASTDRALNAMARMISNGTATGYDPVALSEIHGCLSDFNLEPLAEGAWSGFFEYATNNSNSTKRPWGKAGPNQYVEYDPSPLPLVKGNITIFERCNTVSNFAYYRTMTSVCKEKADFSIGDDAIRALVQSFAALASGSAFFHASGSIDSVGMALDNLPIGTLSLIAHQASVKSLNSTILSDLSLTPRPITGIGLAEKLAEIVSSDVDQWQAGLDAISATGVGDYTLWFPAIGSSAINLMLPPSLADPLVRLIAKLLLPGPDPSGQIKFLETVYVPTFRNLTADVKLSFTEKFSLSLKGAGVLLKMVYAFLFQEEVLKWPGLYDVDANKLGGEAMPYVNMLCNAMTGFKHADPAIQSCKNVYPGDAACRVGSSPHTKWHEQAANGVYDLMKLADEINRILVTHKLAKQRTASSWLQFWASHWWSSDETGRIEL